MILSKSILPSAVIVEGIYYPIHTDYRYFLLMNEKLKEKEFNENSLDFMFEEKIPTNRRAGVLALVDFMTPRKKLPRILKEARPAEDVPVIDYDLDADLIYAAFYQQYGIDLIETRLHWYKFTALLQGLQNCKLTDIINIRQYEDNGQKNEYNKRQLELKRMWELETDEERAQSDEALKEFEHFIGG